MVNHLVGHSSVYADVLSSNEACLFGTKIQGHVGDVQRMAHAFFGLSFGLGGIGSALFGWLADLTSIQYVFQLTAFLPLLGIATYFLPNIKDS